MTFRRRVAQGSVKSLPRIGRGVRGGPSSRIRSAVPNLKRDDDEH